MKTLAALACLLCLSSAAWLFAAPQAAQDTGQPRLSDLDWLAGAWSAEVGGVLYEEHWMAPAGAMMLGMHRDVHVEGARTLSWEFLRIVEDAEGLRYLASPAGRAPTAFPLEDIAPRRVVFANPEHDFPQRLTYELEPQGETLHVRAEGAGGKTLEWRWRRGP